MDNTGSSVPAHTGWETLDVHGTGENMTLLSRIGTTRGSFTMNLQTHAFSYRFASVLNATLTIVPRPCPEPPPAPSQSRAGAADPSARFDIVARCFRQEKESPFPPRPPLPPALQLPLTATGTREEQGGVNREGRTGKGEPPPAAAGLPHP